MNTLEKQVLKMIAENSTTPDVFTDDATGMAQIRDSINHGVQQLCMVTGSYKKTYFLPLRGDCQFYRMGWETDYFGYVVQAWDRSRHLRLIQTDLVRLSSEDPAFMQRTGYPDQYFQIGYQYIGVYFKPSASDTILELDCVVIPKPYVTDTDPVKLRENFERAAVQFAVSEYHASRGDATRAMEFLNKSLETAGLKRLNPQMNERQYQFGGYRPWQPSTNQ